MSSKHVSKGAVVQHKIALPDVQGFTAPMLAALTEALGVERTVLATDEQIKHTWENLPRLLSRIPPELVDDGMARLCVAVATGLFDSAINYIWNSAVIELREKVKRFGIAVIPKIIDSDFDETKLFDLKDAELLDLCLKLNLISEEGYFMLNQCREIRNNFSAAHPTIGTLDEDELLNFMSRCGRYALSDEHNPRGVDIPELNNSIKGGKFSGEQFQAWGDRVEDTFDAQRELIFGMLHGIYCDPESGEEARINSLQICSRFVEDFTPKTQSLLIDRHEDYKAKGEDERHKASQKFFENLDSISLLGESERHAIISSACKKLLSVHNAFDNFYNEPPFAERLASLTSQQAVPATAQNEFVECVVMCAVGNQWGTSNAAVRHYVSMIQRFTPREIQILLELPSTKTIVARRISAYNRCKQEFKSIVGLLDSSSIPTAVKTAYKKWMK